MNANSKRILTVAGAVMTALAIALSMLAFLTVTTRAATGTGMPAMTDIIPDADGTSSLPFPLCQQGACIPWASLAPWSGRESPSRPAGQG